MFNNGNENDASTSGTNNTSPSSSISNKSNIDRLKLLYPNVDEDETPLPRCWSPHDKCVTIGLSQNNLRVHYKGNAVAAKPQNDAASVRTAHPIPAACGIYYFEVKIISKSKNGYMGIGLTAQQFRMNRLPGCDKQSYGYHGAEGNSFSSSGHGQSYGPTFTTGDIIGCCVNFVNNTCFYTKNGIDLGIAFRDLPSKLYPTVGLQAPGEEVDANFGQEPFKFDQIEEMMKQMRAEVKATINDFPLTSEHGDPTTFLQKMVSSYLVHNGYSETAEAFARTTNQTFSEDMTSIRNRQKILKLIMCGKMGQAIEHTLRSYPGLLENNKSLWFMLKCRQFIEMINGSDVECSSNDISMEMSPTKSNTNSETPPPNQTSVIQSTKFYQNGNTNGNYQDTTIMVAKDLHSINTNDNYTNCNNTKSQKTTMKNNNKTQNSNHLNVINADNKCRNQSNLDEKCSKTNDILSIRECCHSNNDFINDIEMENNIPISTIIQTTTISTTATASRNGGICKNGDVNSSNSSITIHSSNDDEEMDVDGTPVGPKYSHGIERILEFGKDLSIMGQQLEKEHKMAEEDRQMLEDAFSLIAYSNPWSSPLGWQLCPSKREIICTALNSAILASMNYTRRPPLEYCVAHASELLKIMGQASLGACAFINIKDVFPKN